MLGYCVESEHRMTCPDYIEDFALACEKQDVSLFLLAGKPGVVDTAITKLKAIAPICESRDITVISRNLVLKTILLFNKSMNLSQEFST